MTDKLNHQISVIEKLLKKPENKLCADCKRTSPSWASISIGIFICIKCAGFHREMGTHISKVKSINLDLWPHGILNNFLKISNILFIFYSIDNKIANEYWEHKLKDMNFEKIRDDDNRLQDFIRDKYDRKRYVNSKKRDPMSLIVEGLVDDNNQDEVKNDE
jgi:stromal membrane-associated protein